MMNTKTLLIWSFGVLIILMFGLIIKFLDTPECYLIENSKECGFLYYEKWDTCWEKYNLKQCCKGSDYLLKGVYGDSTCWWIYSGFNETLLKEYDNNKR